MNRVGKTMTTPITKEQLPDERLVKILSETQAVVTEQNSRCVRGSIEVDARLFESMLVEIQLRRHLMEKAALAAMDAEPAGWQVKKHGGNWGSIKDEEVHHYKFNEELPVREVYTAPPAPVVPDSASWEDVPEEITEDNMELALAWAHGFNQCRAAMLQSFGNSEQLNSEWLNESVSQPYKLAQESGSSLQLRNLIRKRHAEWSDATFGNVGPIGPLKHLSKEALEAAAEPDDLSEWADMQFLLWDAQRRTGISDGEITAAMEEKLKVNMARQWPEPKDGEPRMHIKDTGNSPVIPDGWQQWVSEVVEYLENGLEADGELEAQGSIDAKRLLSAAPQQEVKP